jgi:hypothetical protein
MLSTSRELTANNIHDICILINKKLSLNKKEHLYLKDMRVLVLFYYFEYMNDL